MDIENQNVDRGPRFGLIGFLAITGEADYDLVVDRNQDILVEQYLAEAEELETYARIDIVNGVGRDGEPAIRRTVRLRDDDLLARFLPWLRPGPDDGILLGEEPSHALGQATHAGEYRYIPAALLSPLSRLPRRIGSQDYRMVGEIGSDIIALYVPDGLAVIFDLGRHDALIWIDPLEPDIDFVCLVLGSRTHHETEQTARNIVVGYLVSLDSLFHHN